MNGKYKSNFTYIDNSKRNSVLVIATYIFLIALIFALLISIFFYAEGAVYTWQDLLYTIGSGAVLGALVALCVCLYTYRKSGEILAKAANAYPVDPKEEPYLFETVDAVSGGVGLTCPSIYIIETSELNAFASGSSRGKSMVAVTRGLLQTLNREELEGVIAHEISHLKNDDIKFVSLAVALSATLLLITSSVRHGLFTGRRSSNRSDSKGGAALVVLMLVALVIVVITPLLARALQGAVSRQREFLADASGAAILGYPLGLASALEKIGAVNREQISGGRSAFANSSVHALCISDPTEKRVSGLFATHPPIAERIRRLRGE